MCCCSKVRFPWYIFIKMTKIHFNFTSPMAAGSFPRVSLPHPRKYHSIQLLWCWRGYAAVNSCTSGGGQDGAQPHLGFRDLQTSLVGFLVQFCFDLWHVESANQTDRPFPHCTLQYQEYFATNINWRETLLFQDAINASHPRLPCITSKRMLLSVLLVYLPEELDRRAYLHSECFTPCRRHFAAGV